MSENRAPVARRRTVLALGGTALLLLAVAAAGDRGLTATGLQASVLLLPLFCAAVFLARKRPTGRTDGRGLAVGAALLMFAGSFHEQFANPGSDKLVAAALYLFCAACVLGSAPALVRSMRHQRIPDWRFFVLPLAFYSVLAPWTTDQRPPDGDEPWYLLVTHSIVHDRDTALGNNYRQNDSLEFIDRVLEPQPGDPGTTEEDRAQGRAIRSRHGMLLPLVLAPAYAAAGFPGTVATMMMLAALACWLTAGLLGSVGLGAQRTGHRGARVLAWSLFSISAPMMLYSTQLWVEVPAMLLLLVGFREVQLLREKRTLVAAGHSTKRFLRLVAALVVLPVLKLRFGVLAASLALLVVLRVRLQPRQIAALGAASVTALVAVLFYNQATFGNPLRIHQWQELLLRPSQLWPMVLRSFGLLFDNAFGLFAAAPLWLAVLPGCWILLRKHRDLALTAAVVSVPYLTLVASRVEWYGGWSPHFRYPLALLPFAALAVAAALARRHGLGARLLLGPLTLASAGFGALWTAAPGWTYNFATGSSYWLDQWTMISAVDWMRWLPSATRPSKASWVVPLIVGCCVISLWLWKRRPRSANAAMALGTALAMIALAVSTAALKRLDTVSIEAESAIVQKTGGHPEPNRWIYNRTRFREGWTIRHGERLLVPVRAGGENAQIEVALRFFRNRGEDQHVQIYADDRPVGGLKLSQADEWQLHSIGPFPWRGARQLIIEAGPPLSDGQPGVVNGFAVDYVRFLWQP